MVMRIEMLSIEQAKTAARECGIRESMASLNVYRTLLRHPQLASAVNHLLTTLLFTGNKLDVRLRELLIMRIGWTTGAKYEWTQHWRVAHVMLNIPEQDLVATRDWKNASCLSDADRAILAATDETLDKGMISDATWKACASHLKTPQERIELVVAIGNWTMFSQLLKSLKIPLEDGVSAWPPDGKAP